MNSLGERRAGLPVKLAMLAAIGFSAADCTPTAQSTSNTDSAPAAAAQTKEGATPEARAIEFGKKIINLFKQRNYSEIKNAYLPEELQKQKAANRYFDFHLTVFADNFAKCESTGHPVQLNNPQVTSKNQPNGDIVSFVVFPFAGECRASGIDISGAAITLDYYKH